MSRFAAALLAAFAVAAVPAAASTTQESIFMDDPKVVYSAPDKLEATLTEMKQLGAERIRVSVFWHLLAPAPRSQERPFPEGAGADPRNYSAEKWDRYDRIVTTAEQLGLELLFNLTAPAPHWATPSPPSAEQEDSFRPSASEFKDFAKAVGARYSGTFADEAARQSSTGVFDDCLPTPNFPLPPDICPPDSTDPSPDDPNPPNTGPLLPRVDTWSIWNEPNMPGWLTPQSHENDTTLAASPHVYRELADAMYSGLLESGHGIDTILIAETAPRGAFKRGVSQSLPPLLFVRELYCLDSRFRPFKGDAAARRDCPDGGGFREAHPVLFDATAFAHHPYAFEAPPGATDRTKDHVVMGDLGRLTETLDRILARYGSSRQFPVWLTEYGYQTNPPDPYVGWPWKKQARFLAHAEWLAYRQPRVRSTAQFLLYDDAPLRDYPPSEPRHWGTFQTGLRTAQGEQKTAYASYQRGIHVVRPPRSGRPARVFGYYRAAPGETPARIEFKRRGRTRWRVVEEIETNADGFLLTKVAVRRAGTLRIAFGGDASGYTRAARVGAG